MIKSFKNRQTALISGGNSSRKLPQDMQRNALKKLRQLDAAATLDVFRQVTVWKLYEATAKASTAYASMINGVCVFASTMAMLSMSK